MQQSQGDNRVGDFHKRVGQSHSEARKLLTGMGVGGVGVLYATLTGKDAPILDVYSKQRAFAAVVLMGSSVLFGLLAWIADALWAKKAAANFEKTPALPTPDGDPWHTVKRCCDWVQLVLFLVGFSAAALLTLHHL